MKMYLNFKKIIYFFGVLFFMLTSNYQNASIADAITVLQFCTNNLKTPTDSKETIKEHIKYCKKTLSNPETTSATQCLEEKEALEKNWKDFQAACNANAKTTAEGANCKERLKNCAKLKSGSDTNWKEYAKDNKAVEKINENIDTLAEKITDLGDEKVDEHEKLEEKMATLVNQRRNTNLFKQCPIFATLATKAYKDAKKDNKKERKELKKEHNDLAEEILDLEQKRDETKEKGLEKINTLGEGILKHQRDFEKEQKKLKKELKDKIANKRKETEEQQNLIRTLNAKRQELIDNAEKRQFEREDRCHKRALESLAERKKARVQRIINKTNRISFATLIKRSKLSRKDRNKQYRQKMYTECLSTPSEQKWLKREKKILIQTKISLLKQQEGAVKKIKQAQKDLEKIASENHLEAGELLERSKKDGEQLTQKIKLAQDNLDRSLKTIAKRIANKKEQLKLKLVELQDTNLSDLEAQSTLARTSKTDNGTTLDIKNFIELETALSNLDAATQKIEAGSCLASYKESIKTDYNETTK